MATKGSYNISGVKSHLRHEKSTNGNWRRCVDTIIEINNKKLSTLVAAKDTLKESRHAMIYGKANRVRYDKMMNQAIKAIDVCYEILMKEKLEAVHFEMKNK